MKRILLFSLLSLMLAAPGSRGQDGSSTSTAAVSRQEAEENYKTLAGQVKDLIDANADKEKKLQALAKDVAALRDQLGKPVVNNYATQDEVKKLADAINALDEKWKAENKRMLADISDQIARLGNVSARPVPPPPHVKDPPVTSAVPAMPAGSATDAAPTGEGFKYRVQPGDTYIKIANKLYKEKQIKIGWEKIAAANPTIKSSELKVDQEIFIPMPKPDTGKTP